MNDESVTDERYTLRDWVVGLTVFAAWIVGCGVVAGLYGEATQLAQGLVQRLAVDMSPVIAAVAASVVTHVLPLGILAFGFLMSPRWTDKREILFLIRGLFVSAAMAARIVAPQGDTWLPSEAFRLWELITGRGLLAVAGAAVALLAVRWLVRDERAARAASMQADRGRLS